MRAAAPAAGGAPWSCTRVGIMQCSAVQRSAAQRSAAQWLQLLLKPTGPPPEAAPLSLKCHRALYWPLPAAAMPTCRWTSTACWPRCPMPGAVCTPSPSSRTWTPPPAAPRWPSGSTGASGRGACCAQVRARACVLCVCLHCGAVVCCGLLLECASVQQHAAPCKRARTLQQRLSPGLPRALGLQGRCSSLLPC
jgi:hypothetical protein